jgi:endonuclease/exonuclease/phosphatase family metal-dependent hydrolase
MVVITDRPPDEIRKEVTELRSALDIIPTKQVDRNLLIATWNIRHFGDLTKKWQSTPEDCPKRDFHSLICIAEIISRFDVIAVQEVKANVRAFRHLMKYLGQNWSFLVTDETKGYRGNGERMAFIFDTRKVQLSGLACELVIPEDPKKKRQHSLDTQFARTPYAVGFHSGGKTFILVTLHVKYGKEVERKPELEAISVWLKEWALDINAWDHNLITLGDFNINRKGDLLYDAFVKTGLESPPELDRVPRTIFSKLGEPDTHKFYDQIAWFRGIGEAPALSLEYKDVGGHFDFTKIVLQNRNLTLHQKSWHISDHFPLWVEFNIRPKAS